MAELAPRPINETRRAQAVIRTGLISNPKPELFQIYCDLAKDLTGFDVCYILLIRRGYSMWYIGVGPNDFETGTTTNLDENNICTHVLLSPNPLIMPDLKKTHIGKTIPVS